MKKYVLTFHILFLALTHRAQPCFSGNTSIFITQNEVGAIVTNSGTNLTNYTSPGYTVPFKFGSPERRKYTIGAASIWIGGKDASGELKVAASSYPEAAAVGDYVNGPIPATGSLTDNVCGQWNKIWIVYSTDIRSHINIFRANGINNNPPESLLKWPAKGNPHFKTQNGFDLPDRVEGYAPFYDANNDGIYNPVNGDYPALNNNGCFVPDYMAWSIYNDVGGQHIHSKSAKPVNVEIQQIVWGISAIDSVLNRSLFTSYKIIYRGTQPLDSTYLGLWTEFDLGCPDDDFHGCDVSSNSYYGYNSDKAKDISCSNSEGYGDNPPVQAVTMLNKTLNKFTYYFIGSPTNLPVGTHDPKTTDQFYNYMTGKWKDGSTFKKGGNGYNLSGGVATDFAFPDDPTNTNGWSMVSANMPKNYVGSAVIGSTNLGKLTTGQVINLDVAYTYHRKGGFDGWQNVGQMRSEVANIKSLYNSGFANYQKCIKVSTKEIGLSQIKIFPNPTNGSVFIESENEPIQSIRIFDSIGKLVYSNSKLENNRLVNLDIKTLPNGIYLVKCSFDIGVEVKKINLMN